MAETSGARTLGMDMPRKQLVAEAIDLVSKSRMLLV